ncbi:hypothetical protein [Rufibacter hautae]|uniref:Uncharacterized protein n=1 Tax=Rufibacter hautae TaxID=2595005 RepID=A0A5B6TEB5_9BACT|nr:hypothetical protein [Rufibacter hautae]KAA3438488.1 hypothetical protein FOA19_14735 [Rufibacter hautae]
MLAAGFERLNQFGFFGTMVQRCRAEGISQAEFLQRPADVFYMELVHDAIANDCQKDLQGIQKNKSN